MLLNILVGLCGIILGFVTCFLIKRREINAIQKEKEEIRKNNEKLKTELAGVQAQIRSAGEFQEMIKKDFSELANEVIKQEQKDLREQNKEALEEKFKPLKEDFEKFRQTVQAFNVQGVKQTTAITEQIKNLMTQSISIQTTANELSNAIRDNSKERGNLGEFILDNLLKQAGLINRKDDEEKGNYITQKVLKDYENPSAKPTPDAVVFFPDNKHIIIDSKFPLNHYRDYCNANSEEEKREREKAFYKAVIDMINSLSGKYNTLEGLNTPEFKLMFIPFESCSNFIYSNKDIIEEAAKKNIVIVCPSTLLAVLKIINKTWAQKNMEENIAKITKSIKSIYEKLDTFIKKTKTLQNSMMTAQKSFNEMLITAEGQNGLITQIANLKNTLENRNCETEENPTETE